MAEKIWMNTTIFTLNIRTDYNDYFFLLSEYLILKKILIFLVSEYLRTPKNYQSLRVFTGVYICGNFSVYTERCEN